MIAVYPGSFDPVTYGHIDIIRRVARFADRLIVGVVVNINKTPFFNYSERLEFLSILTSGMENVVIKSFEGMLVDFAAENKADIIIRGLRTAMISEYEYQMSMANIKYAAKEDGFIDTHFVLSKPEHAHISSSLAKEIVICGGNAEDMIPKYIIEAIKKKL